MADNHALIYHILSKNNWSIDKYYDVAAIGLCKAALSFDEGLGYTFSTYAARVMENAVLDEFRRKQTQMRNKYKEVSLDDRAIKGQIEKSAREDQLESLMVSMDVRNAMNTLHEDDRAVAELLAEGYTQPEISKKLGISEAKFKKTLENIKDALSDFVY